MKIIPILATTTALAFFTATPTANADPVAPYVANYASVSAPAVCAALDAYPTFPGLVTTTQAIQNDTGFTLAQAAQVLGISVINHCPRHIPLLNRSVAPSAPTAEVMA